MCCWTPGGTSPAIDSPAATRARIAVDETSAVGASIKEIIGSICDNGSSGGRTMRDIRRGSRCGSSSTGRAWPRHDGEVCRVEDRGVVVPRGNFCKRVGADDEKQLRRRVTALVELRECSGRVRGRGGSQLEVGRPPALARGDGERDHGKAVERRRKRLLPVRRDVRRDDVHPRQPQRLLSAGSDVQMAAVNRVEGAAEDADPSRDQCQDRLLVRQPGVTPPGAATWLPAAPGCQRRLRPRRDRTAGAGPRLSSPGR